MKTRTKLIAIGILAAIIGIPAGYYYTQLPKYSDAIMHGTVENAYQGCCAPGFGTTSFFNLNITLDKGAFGDMGVWNDCPCVKGHNCGGIGITTNSTDNQPCADSFPVKLPSGIWDYLVRVSCTYFKAGDSIDLRVPLYQGGNIWSEPKAVQGYNYNNLSPHTYDYPAVYKEQGAGFVPIEGC